MQYFSSKIPTGLYLELYFIFFVLTINLVSQLDAIVYDTGIPRNIDKR